MGGIKNLRWHEETVSQNYETDRAAVDKSLETERQTDDLCSILGKKKNRFFNCYCKCKYTVIGAEHVLILMYVRVSSLQLRKTIAKTRHTSSIPVHFIPIIA